MWCGGLLSPLRRVRKTLSRSHVEAQEHMFMTTQNSRGRQTLSQWVGAWVEVRGHLGKRENARLLVRFLT